MRHTLLMLVLLVLTTSARGANWSYWRGPEQNGVSRERDLPDKFSLDPKAANNNLLFAVPYGSITTPIVQDGQVYLINKVGHGITQQERVMAFDATTGKPVWEHRFNAWHTDIVEDRLGFTNMVGDPETGNVYAQTTAGEFVGFSKGGKILWKRSLTEEFGRVSGYGGRITSAVVDEDKVILSMINANWGEQTVGNTRFLALDKKTGEVVWWGSGGYRVKDTYYSVPIIAVIKGERLVIGGGGDGCVHAFKARTGEKVWSYKLEDGGGAINCSPVVKGNKVWIAHGEENEDNSQGRIVCLDAGAVTKGKPKLVWKYDGVKVKFASPILHEGLLYVCDAAGKLYCFDADKGGDGELWSFRYGRNTKGSPVLADGKIYISEVDSKFHILKPGKDGCKRLSEVFFPPVGIAQTELQGSPAVVNGRVYFTTTNQLICIGKKDHKPAKITIPALPKEASAGTETTHIQIVPADATLKPGASVEFKAYAYDKGGRRLGEVKVEWERAGIRPPVFPIGFPPVKPQPGAKPPPPIAGKLGAENGTATSFTAAQVPNGQFGRVVAKSGKITGEARVRVVPSLPYMMDFEKVPVGRTPGGWVNTQGKFSVIKLPDGNQVLSKRNDNASPLLARANAYIGDPEMKDYTIESDIYAKKVRDKDMPDVGVGACRYVMSLIGNDQELRLVTWDAQKRINKTMPFNFKPDTWYHMKLTATVVDGKGIIKGKVWAKGEKEPEKWTIEAEDPIPNTEGAPLIFGFANGTINAASPGPDLYYDNVKITPNKK